MLCRSRAKPRLEIVPLPATSRRVKFANSATPAHEFSCSSYFRVGWRCAAGTWVAHIERAGPAMRWPEAISRETMMQQDVPIIDLTPYRNGADKAGVAKQVDRACR